jgi:hypothetical protein
MKKNKWALWIIVVIVAATAVTAVVFRSMQNAITGIEIADGSRTVLVSFEELNQTSFEGSLINGKGERSEHSYEGCCSAICWSRKASTCKMAVWSRLLRRITTR